MLTGTATTAVVLVLRVHLRVNIRSNASTSENAETFSCLDSVPTHAGTPVALLFQDAVFYFRYRSQRKVGKVVVGNLRHLLGRKLILLLVLINHLLLSHHLHKGMIRLLRRPSSFLNILLHHLLLLLHIYSLLLLLLHMHEHGIELVEHFKVLLVNLLPLHTLHVTLSQRLIQGLLLCLQHVLLILLRCQLIFLCL